MAFLGYRQKFFPVPCGTKGSSVETNAERQGGGQRTRKMMPIKLILEISRADINKKGECLMSYVLLMMAEHSKKVSLPALGFQL